MASDLNKVILIGRLTREPELKATQNGSYFCRLTLASNRSVYNRQTGESRDEVGFFDCTAWGKQAETIHKYVQKGRRIAVEGHLHWSSWESADGKKQSKVDVTVEAFQFLDSKAQEGDQRVPPDSGAAAAFDGGDEEIPY